VLYLLAEIFDGQGHERHRITAAAVSLTEMLSMIGSEIVSAKIA